MPWVRRTRHFALAADPGGAPRVGARSFLTGELVVLSAGELQVLLEVPVGEWVWRSDADAEAAARRGLLVSDEPGEPYETLRRRDAELTSLGWWPEAAALHLSARWDGVRGRVPAADGTSPRGRRRRGRPLPAFPERGGPRVPLPPVSADSALARLLDGRRTVRSYAAGEPVGAGDLAVLLRRVWGAHGTARFAMGDVGIRKTSPSGGGLHPIEVYPLVRRVAGVAPGVYHYLAGAHELECLGELEDDAVRSLVEEATAGQWYLAEADVSFVMTARFGRSYWKYRRHPKAYRTIFLDAGHLSQTFYLVCGELGLGPWVTAALNDGALERALAVDPLHEGLIALCGCGRLPAEPGALDLSVERVDP